MRILVLPPSDYLGHPNPCRLHHIFEQFPEFGDEIYVMRFATQQKIVRESKATVLSIGDTQSASLPTYYFANMGLFGKAASDIIKKYDVDVVLFANLLPPYLVSKVVPKDLLSVVDLVDHYAIAAADYAPAFFPKAVVKFAFSHLMESIIKNSDSTVACSYKLADYAKSVGGKNVHRIPNGVEEYFFSNYESEATEIRQKLGVTDSELSICFVGNVEYWLSMEDFLQALYKVKKSATKKIKFVIVGGKLTTNYMSHIDNTIRALSLEENVVQVGFVPHAEVPKYVAASDLCVSPLNPLDPVSYYASPVKVWEYLSQEKPVLSTAIPEVLRTANDCVTITTTAKDYFDSIMSFLGDPEPFLEKARKGKQRSQEYTWQKIAKNYRELLQYLLSPY